MRPEVSQGPNQLWLHTVPVLRGAAEGGIDAEGQSCRVSVVPGDEGRASPGCSTRAGDHGAPVQGLGRGADAGGDEWRNADVRAEGLVRASGNVVVPDSPSVSSPVWVATRYGHQYEGRPLGCGPMPSLSPALGNPQAGERGYSIVSSVYFSYDPAIIAVGPDHAADIPCGSLLWVCNPNAARLGSRAPTDRVGVGLREPPTPCILGVRADYCPGCRENHIDLSEAGINILAGLAPDGSQGQADRLTGLSMEVLP